MSLIVNEKTHRIGTSVAANEIRLDLSIPYPFKNKEIALNHQTIYYSWFNITNAYNNTSFSYRYNGTTYPINMPEGFYLIGDINNYLELTMYTNNHYVLDSDANPVYFLKIVENPTYYRVTVVANVVSVPSGGTNPNTLVTGSTMQLVVPDTGFATVIGFSAGNYPTSPSVSNYSANGDKIPEISQVSSVLVGTNISNNDMNQYRDVISIFTPDNTFGSLLKVENRNLIWYPVFDSSYSSISVFFYDQDHRPLQLVDKSSCVANLIFRDRQN